MLIRFAIAALAALCFVLPALAQDSDLRLGANPNNGLSRVMFGNYSDPVVGEIRFNHNTGVMSLLAHDAAQGLYPYLIFNPQTPAHKVTVQRLYEGPSGAVNPKTLYVQTNIRGAGETSGFPTGLASYVVSDTPNASAQAGDAVSGVFEKRQQNPGIGFGGHFQCKDLNPVTLGGCIGFESNVVALGPDVNQNRMVGDIIARTLRGPDGQPAGAEASVARALRIRDDETSGYFERGIQFSGDFPGGQIEFGVIDGHPVFVRLNVERRRLEWRHGAAVLAAIPLDGSGAVVNPDAAGSIPEWCTDAMIGILPACTP